MFQIKIEVVTAAGSCRFLMSFARFLFDCEMVGDSPFGFFDTVDDSNVALIIPNFGQSVPLSSKNEYVLEIKNAQECSESDCVFVNVNLG